MFPGQLTVHPDVNPEQQRNGERADETCTEQKHGIRIVKDSSNQRDYIHCCKKDDAANSPTSNLPNAKAYLVNMYQIKLFSAKGVELLDGRSVPVSRPRYAKAKECFLQFLGEHEE